MSGDTPPIPTPTTHAAGGLIAPLVIWGPKPPENKMTAARFLSDRTTLVTGAENGHVIVWKCGDDALNPAKLMIGHECAITAISPTSTLANSTRVVTCSADGQLCLWDIQDGRCVNSTSSIYVHRQMQPYVRASEYYFAKTECFCLKTYVVFKEVEPDWISSFVITSNLTPNRPDRLIGVTMVGMIKVWSLVELEKKDLANALYEDESKRLELLEVQSVSFNPANSRYILVVTAACWQLVDLHDLVPVVSVECPHRAVYGQLIDIDKAAICHLDHTIQIYQLPIQILEGPQVLECFGKDSKNYLGAKEPFEVARLEGLKEEYQGWINGVSFTFSSMLPEERQNAYQVARASRTGQLSFWRIPRFDKDFMRKITTPTQLPLVYKGTFEESLETVWQCLNEDEISPLPALNSVVITCSLFVASQGKLLLGRQDGLIMMTYACEILSRQLLEVPQERSNSRKLVGHKGAVRSMFYPHEHHFRFDPQLLLSGADDFSVIVWNINTATRIHRFVVHGGPILRFCVPPTNTSRQVVKCVCSIAADHSVALLNIKEMRCMLLASRHPHPVKDVKWRPLDDFMLVKLDDGSVYVWQMETANIDRIVTGLLGEDVFAACDEQIGREEGTDETTGASHAVQMLRAIKHKNIDAVKQQVVQTLGKQRHSTEAGGVNQLGPPMSIVPLPGCNMGAHLVQFEVSNLIGGILNIDASEEAVKAADHDGPIQQIVSRTDMSDSRQMHDLSKRLTWQFEANLYLDVARLMLSLLHGWFLDDDLDSVCLKRLSLCRPLHQLYFGNISRHGQFSVVLPQRFRRSYESYARDVRWQASNSLTTTHLLAIISTANTLMGMKNAVVQLSSRSRRSVAAPHPSIPPAKDKESSQAEKQQIKQGAFVDEMDRVRQGWSLVAALHCVLLPDYVRPRSSYAPPRIELLARRWQDGCIEIREAAQALLVRELARLGGDGRRRLIESWAPFLPPLLDESLSIFGARMQSSVPSAPPSAPPPPIPPRSRASPPSIAPVMVPDPPTSEDGESGVQQVRRNQATAIILLGVVGAEFGDELNRADLTRATATSLLELLTMAPSPLLPIHSPLRRAAIDLLGRGFVYWEPHLEVSKVLLGLLDLAANSDKQPVPPLVGAPLPPIADACRTARHALSLIAQARAPAVITALSMEVARYNSAAQHQTIQHTVASPLLKARFEVNSKNAFKIEFLQDKT
ncbi:hypothetical protein WR25_21206 isoform A [Diploscapter pachys]|uniref:Uncharacterized protein n=1 Tax=Diploscapter pachys TaxID=2018661 RepID=A0A2A2KXZ2_9BILA|nr:hypothetical protein WR25_21206 isoform A [Diploscapter pachys]